MSYNKFWTSNWIGSIGRNGRFLAHFGREWQHAASLAAVIVGGNAKRQHLLDGAFANHEVFAIAVAHDHRHAAAHEVERDFVDFLVVLQLVDDIVLHRVVENCNVQEILQTRLKEAVKPSKFQNLQIVFSMHIEVAFEDDLVLRQRAGLVGTKDIHRPKVLDRIQSLN